MSEIKEKLLQIFDRLIYKISSGRFILTVIAGGAFFILSVNGVIPVDDFIKIFLVILTFYFTLNRDKKV